MRLLRPLALCTLIAAMLLPAAEGVVAKVAKKSNVRYGPSKLAAVAVTLSPEATVEILGRITKDDGVWYQIRFPREGRSWMHEKTLKLQDTPEKKTYEVVEDKARMRDDATAGANIVAELSKGDTVEFRDNKVGAWLAVYSTKAVAYVHESVLAVPQVGGSGVKTVAEPVAPEHRAIERLWATAKSTYGQYAGTQDLKSALTLDWVGLSKQLGEVAANHPELSVRMEAQRLKNGVDAVVKEQKRQVVHATVSVPQPPAEPTEVVPVTKPADPVVPVNPTDLTDPLANLPKPTDPTANPSPEVQQVMAGPAAGAYLVQGILEQRGEIFVVYNNSGKVVAVLQAKPGATLQLADYYWREVGVKGTSPGVGKDDQGNDVPIVLVDDIELLKK